MYEDPAEPPCVSLKVRGNTSLGLAACSGDKGSDIKSLGLGDEESISQAIDLFNWREVHGTRSLCMTHSSAPLRVLVLLSMSQAAR